MKGSVSLLLALAFLASASNVAAQERDSLSRYLDRDMDPAIMLEGNYRVSRGMPVPGAPFPERVTLIRHMEYECETGLDHPRCRQFYLTSIVTGDTGWSLRGRPGGSAEVAPGRVAVDWEYGVPGESILVAGGDRNLYGVWQEDENVSSETWTRVEARPDRWSVGWTDPYSGPRIFPGADEQDITAIEGSRRITAVYHSRWPNRTSRGSRPTFRINLFGEDMWGVHYVRLTGPVTSETGTTIGLEPRPLEYICEQDDGSWRRLTTDWWICGGGANVIGFSVPLVIWPETEPGDYILWINGRPYPFELDVRDYPGPLSQCLSQELTLLPPDTEFRVFDFAATGFLADAAARFRGMEYQARHLATPGAPDVWLDYSQDTAFRHHWSELFTRAAAISHGQDPESLRSVIDAARFHYRNGRMAILDAAPDRFQEHHRRIADIAQSLRDEIEELRAPIPDLEGETRRQRERLLLLLATRDREQAQNWQELEQQFSWHWFWAKLNISFGMAGTDVAQSGSTSGVRSMASGLNRAGFATALGETLANIILASLELSSYLEIHGLIGVILPKLEILAATETATLPRYEQALSEIEAYRDELVLIVTASRNNCDWRERWEANGGR
jgi:hypothetical protein